MSWTQTEYVDINRRVVVRSDLEAKGDGKKVAVQFFDQLGRVRLAKTLEDATNQSATNETDGIKVQTRYFTNSYTCPWDDGQGTPELCSAQLTSNPYRAATSGTTSGEETMGWTLSQAQNTGRYSTVTTYAGANLPAGFGGSNANSTGTVTTLIDANRTLVTDQAGKRRISKTNALGQLEEVWEVLAASEPGSESVAFPNTTIAHGFKTTYGYDTLNNLTTVSQGVQTRIFSYSSLSRLLSAANPESGTISYQYDPNGNLTSKTDARSITTTYSYDALNRVTQRSYSGETGYTTPTVNYTYGTVAPAIGRLTKVASSISTTEYTEFDILGRIKAHKQTTDGQDYTTGYVYNLSGALIEQTYPSGRKVKSTLDADGNLAQVHSLKSSSDIWRPYASNFVYTAAGAVSSLKLGNGRWESTEFNSRLQPTQIGLGVTPNATNILKLDYSYGTTANNGNVLSQTITVPSVTIGGTTHNGFTAVQNYAYDSLNRLDDAAEYIDENPTPSWRQDFTFDRYGNRNFDEANTTTLPKDCTESGNPVVCEAIRPIVNPSANAGDNRLDGYTFDPAGNTTVDAEGRQFTYDAENKQVKVKDPQNQTIGEYFYNGDGLRIKKVVPGTGETTIFAYDASNRLVAEYSTVIEPTATAKTSYLTTDHLGSPRILTDENGATISRRDFMPYGEEIARQNYGADVIRQKFTTYERDGETDLDFAQARYYRSQHGRFTATDPLLTTGRPFNPNTWNRYAYTLGNPLRFVDPSGLYECADSKDCSSDNDRKFERHLRKAQEHLVKIGKKYGIDSTTYVNAKRALDAYGRKGEVNGITVSFGETKEGKATAGGLINGNKKAITVTFDLNKLKDEGDFQAAIGHEGSHAKDRADLADAMLAAIDGDFKFEKDSTLTNYQKVVDDDSLNLTSFQTESRAYGVTSVLAEFSLKSNQNLALGDSGVLIAGNPAWANLDKAKLMSERSAAIADGLNKDSNYSKKGNRDEFRFIPR